MTRYSDKANAIVQEMDNRYQLKLVSGTNIKTINNNSLLGSGNISIQGGGSDVGTFTDLNTIIRNASDGDIITLDKDYKYNATTDTNLITGISLKGVTINGNGHIIDGNNSASIFTIIDTGIVKLNNLIIQNANGTYQNGGAIFIDEQSYPTIINNCTFINNYTLGYLGGAIYISNEWNNVVDINDCTFINNKSPLGGAIYSRGSESSYKNTINVNNSIFISNESTFCGSAILGYWKNDININNCVFEKNICTEEGGDGCVYFANENTSSTLVVKNSLFRNNSGDTYNNIYSDVATTVYNCEIDNIITTCYNISNITTESLNSSKQNTLISGTNIKSINNESLLGSGNISIQGGGVEVGSFTDLQSLITSASSGSTLILDKDYKYNSTTDSSLTDGIVINKNITIIGNGHIIDGDNTQRAFSISMSVIVTLFDLRIQNCNGYEGGAIIINDNATVNINNTLFINNSATENGGAIYLWDNTIININNSTFYKNTITGTSSNKGGAISAENNDITININNTLFEQNSANSDGGAICGHATININNSTFNKNTTNNGSGGAIYSEIGGFNITNCTFNQNTATGTYSTGGAIYLFMNNTSTMRNSSFKDNIATSYNDIDSDEEITVYDCVIPNIITSCYNVTNITIESLVDMIGNAIAYINQ